MSVRVDPVKTFTFHGINLDIPDEKNECKGTCPFCNKDKFSVTADEGLWHCWVCDKRGNKYTFLQEYYEHCLNDTKDQDYKALAKLRGNGKPLPQKIFQNSSLAFDRSQRRWLIPVYSQLGSMVNLRVWGVPEAGSKDKPLMMNTQGCKAHLYRADEIGDASKVYVCEGEWDAMMLEWLFDKIEEKDAAVVAVPGANTFKTEWAELFRGKQVFLCYDNDDAGRQGVKRTAKVLADTGFCTSIHSIDWPDTFQEKYDIGDMISHSHKSPKKTWASISNLMGQDITPRKKLKGCGTFDELITFYEKHVHITPQMEEALWIMLAVLYSNHIPGDPLWVFIVGPPGSGKTMMLHTIADSQETYWLSSMTANTLISGWRDKETNADPSVILKCMGKTVVLKDYTEIMSLPLSEQEEIYGQLRGAYDGHISKPYGNGLLREYPPKNSKHKTCHFSLVAGVTEAIYGDNRAHLGERFLKYSIVPPDYNPIEQILRAIDNAEEQKNVEAGLKDAAQTFLMKNPINKDQMPSVPKWYKDCVVGLAQMVSVLRAVVERKNGELMYRPSPEVGTRLAKQLIRLSQCLAWVKKKKKVDAEVYDLVSKVAWDTCYGWHREVLSAIMYYENGASNTDIEKHARISGSNLKRTLDDLQELGAVQFDLEANEEGKRGRPKKIWFLEDAMKQIISMANLQSTPIYTELIKPKTRKPIKVPPRHHKSRTHKKK